MPSMLNATQRQTENPMSVSLQKYNATPNLTVRLSRILHKQSHMSFEPGKV